MAGPRSRSATPARKLPRGDARADAERHSIRVTSAITGIPLDTLRMWERRYGFPRPQRSEGGGRVYSASDVDTLKLLRRAMDLGYRAGEVVGQSSEALLAMVATASRAATPLGGEVPTVDALLSALGRDEVGRLRAGLRHAAVALGPRRFVTEIAQPLARRVGDLWAEGKLEVRHEHLLTECLSAQLQLLLATFDEVPGEPRVLLATLPGERHGLGLEMVEVYLAQNHVVPRLLGVDTPEDQIVKAARDHDVRAVGLLVTLASDRPATAKRVRRVLAELPRRVQVWLGGAGSEHLLPPKEGVRVILTWEDLDEALLSLRHPIALRGGGDRR